MDIIDGDIYDYPRYYDLVFGSDWKAEFEFLEDCFRRHVSGETRRLFEPACGTGRLVYRFAEAGYQISGLDLNPHAIGYCNARLERRGLKPTAFVGDMSDFTLPRPVDAAFNTINSFRHLQTEKSAHAHFQCVAAALRSGGIYVLGLHLTPLEGAVCDEESWSARRGHLCVNTHMLTTSRDMKKREERCAMSYMVHTPKRSFQLSSEVIFRTYTSDQMARLLAKTPDLNIVGVYDFAYDMEEPVEIGPQTEDVVFVLQKS
ncbi:MAG: class I SAM-dependent methyltransferase [Pirellulaceae bacterium]|jgi:SAM-dependent methyltransferase|nr:class I SAM-dependent methyltransferase [Pirellulaceae bacterium]MDP7017790.1 class I SAM-dependent methyltransferase [Pirellulaceae bacterium]